MQQEDRLRQKSLKMLEKISGNLDRLNKKIEVLIELQQNDRNVVQTAPELPLDVMTLLSLPDKLKKTVMALGQIGRATADDVARQTRRARAVESGYLNQLVNMGYIQKERKGKKIYFAVESPLERRIAEKNQN